MHLGGIKVTPGSALPRVSSLTQVLEHSPVPGNLGHGDVVITAFQLLDVLKQQAEARNQSLKVGGEIQDSCQYFYFQEERIREMAMKMKEND